MKNVKLLNNTSYSSSQLRQFRRHITRIAADNAISVTLRVPGRNKELSSLWLKTNKRA